MGRDSKQLVVASLRTLFGLIIVIALVACTSLSDQNQAVTNPNAGRYAIDQDRAPSQPTDLSYIPEVVPEAVFRTSAGNRSPYTILGKTYQVLPSEQGYSERGIASWYGEKFHGHDTSNGEVFDMYLASAAHKTLPIPSFLRVTNLENNRSIVVRVNDRGPFHGDRLIDLSYAAAVKLGYADVGTANVQLDAIVVDSAAAVSSQLSAPKFLQVGAYADRLTAERISQQLRQMTSSEVFIRSVDNESNRRLYRVRIGPLTDSGEIRKITERVVAANLGSPYTVTE